MVLVLLDMLLLFITRILIKYGFAQPAVFELEFFSLQPIQKRVNFSILLRIVLV